MGESLEKIILNYAPDYWEKGRSDEIFPLTRNSSEYENVSREVTEVINSGYTPEIKSIKRFQNVHDFGQFLIREQHLLHLNPNQSYYRVSIKNNY